MHRISAALALSLCAGLASAQSITRATVVMANGQSLPGTTGLTCSGLNDPYTNAAGQIGFTGSSSGGNFVWFDSAVVWLNSDGLPSVLTGAEGTMGVSNSGGFCYSPTIDGDDGAWTQLGVLIVEDQPIPTLPGKLSAFASRPSMSPDGTAYFVGGIRDVAAGTTTNRAFFRVSDPSNPVFDVLWIGGGTYGGLTITTGASNFPYDVSDNNAHRVHVLTATGSTATDLFVHYSATDSVIAREGSPAPGGGENWVAFRIPSTNNAGSWLVAGDTNNPTTSIDEIVAYNNTIIAREGSSYGGRVFAGAIDASSLNNREEVAFISAGTTGVAPSTLFVGAASSLSTCFAIAVGDSIDTDGDGNCDAIISDFNASNTVAPGIDLAEDGMVYVNVDLTPCAGGTANETIIGIRFRCKADFNGDGTLDFFDYLDFVAAFSQSAPSSDYNGDLTTDFFDYLDFVADFSSGC